MPVANWADFRDELFEAAPDLPPCGLNTNSSRTWGEIYSTKNSSYIYGFCALISAQGLTNIWFVIEDGADPPEGVYILLVDRRQNVTYRSNVVNVR